jgi:hypothetical protein
MGPDGESIRIFRSQWNGSDIDLYRDASVDNDSANKEKASDWKLVDSQGNTWNFAGCATSGPATGACLEKIQFLKDYWFDWKNYNPQTTVYNH